MAAPGAALTCVRMTDQTKTDSTGNEDPVKEALKSVARLEQEDELDPDAIEVLRPSDAPPSGDPVDKAPPPPDASLEEAFEGRNENSLEGEATVGSDDEEEIYLDEADAPADGGEKKKDPRDAMLEAMIQAKNEALAALEQTQKEAKSLQERLLRVSADFENFKKRQAREKDDAVRFANERLLKEVLPVLDNADRALDAVTRSADESGDDGVKALADGVAMVFKQLTDTFGRFGVEGFTALGKPFDPALHEAVAQRDDDTVPSGTVIEEYQKGYLLHGRLVRPSMVVVSSGGPPAGGDVGGGEGPTGDGDASEGPPAGDEADHADDGGGSEGR